MPQLHRASARIPPSSGSSMNGEKTKFLVECKMTCFGGSSKGTCDCHCPNDCKTMTDPKWSHYRSEAIVRMQRFAMVGVDKKRHKKRRL